MNELTTAITDDKTLYAIIEHVFFTNDIITAINLNKETANKLRLEWGKDSDIYTSYSIVKMSEIYNLKLPKEVYQAVES